MRLTLGGLNRKCTIVFPLFRLLTLSLSHRSLHTSTCYQRSSPSVSPILVLVLREERVVDGQGKCRAHGGPAGLRDGGVLEANTEVPCQMPQAVHTVEEEWHSDGKLGRSLSPQRPCRNCRHYRSALEVPAESRCCEVCESKKVEATAENDSRETVQTGGVPGDLGSVDGKMRGDGTVEALLRKDLFTSLLADPAGGLGVGKSGKALVSRVPGAC